MLTRTSNYGETMKQFLLVKISRHRNKLLFKLSFKWTVCLIYRCKKFLIAHLLKEVSFIQN